MYLIYSVYLVVHNDSGRVYVGQTKLPVGYRWQIHCRPSSGCLKLKYAIQKYGPDAFSCYELAHGLSAEAADELEIALIREHDSTHVGFNISTGGQLRWEVDTCHRGHDLRPAGARDNYSHCKICRLANQRRHYAVTRADPERWALHLTAKNRSRQKWRANRKAEGLKAA